MVFKKWLYHTGIGKFCQGIPWWKFVMLHPNALLVQKWSLEFRRTHTLCAYAKTLIMMGLWAPRLEEAEYAIYMAKCRKLVLSVTYAICLQLMWREYSNMLDPRNWIAFCYVLVTGPHCDFAFLHSPQKKNSRRFAMSLRFILFWNKKAYQITGISKDN